MKSTAKTPPTTSPKTPRDTLILTVKRFDTSLPLPQKATPQSVGYDLCARETTTILPGTVGLVPLNVAIKPPTGYWILLAARSSLHKKGLSMANGVGIGDPDYCGDGDEYRAALFNFSTQPVIIERGDRIVQMILMPLVSAQVAEVEKLEEKDRGGFGSTGT